MIDPSRKEGQPMTGVELLQFDGISRSVLEDRIVALVRVLDAAGELIASDDAAQEADGPDASAEDERYEMAWERLREALKTL